MTGVPPTLVISCRMKRLNNKFILIIVIRRKIVNRIPCICMLSSLRQGGNL